MERTEAFDIAGLSRLRVKLRRASAAVLCSNVEQFEVVITGSESQTAGIVIKAENGTLSVEQPPASPLSLFSNAQEPEIQVRVFIPTGWKGEISLSTRSGRLEAMGLRGTDVMLNVGSGSMDAASVEAISLRVCSHSGVSHISDVSCERLCLRTLSGQMDAQGCDFRTAHITSAKGNCTLQCAGVFESIRAATASGDLHLTVPFDTADAAFFSHGGGRLRTMGVDLTDSAPEVRMSTLSGDLMITH